MAWHQIGNSHNLNPWWPTKPQCSSPIIWNPDIFSRVATVMITSEKSMLLHIVGNSCQSASMRPTTLEEHWDFFVNFSSIYVYCLRFKAWWPTTFWLLSFKHCFCTFPLQFGGYLQHIEAETRWRTFSRQRLQIHFLEWKCTNFD